MGKVQRVLIAAGGTGGHIYPALALAEAFAQGRKENIQVEFVGTPSGLENQIFKSQPYKLHHINVGKLNRNVGLWVQLKTLIQMPLSLLQSFFLLLRVKPDLVLGVGGYVTGPVLLVAALMRYRTFIWEPNAFPGMANRMLSKYVDECLVVFEKTAQRLRARRVKRVGFPIRKTIEGFMVAGSDGTEESVDSKPFRVLVFGGSQGAHAINVVVADMLELWTDQAANAQGDGDGFIEVLHQTGTKDFSTVQARYAGSPYLRAVPYIDDMAAEYAKADLVICRSGTGTLSELAACAKPAILIPLPTAADDHQRENAQALVDKQAALLIPEKELSIESLSQLIRKVKEDKVLRKSLSNNIKQFHQAKAADAIVQHMLASLS